VVILMRSSCVIRDLGVDKAFGTSGTGAEAWDGVDEASGTSGTEVEAWDEVDGASGTSGTSGTTETEAEAWVCVNEVSIIAC